MSSGSLPPLVRGSVWSAWVSVLLSSSTLVCCALPALLVALGAGAVMAGLVSAVPQLVWLSTHKALVFGVAGGALAAAGFVLWRARGLPCPADADLAQACVRTRRFSSVVYGVAVFLYAIGATFALTTPVVA